MAVHLIHRVCFVVYFSVLLTLSVYCTVLLTLALSHSVTPAPATPIRQSPVGLRLSNAHSAIHDHSHRQWSVLCAVLCGWSFTSAMILAYISNFLVNHGAGWQGYNQEKDRQTRSELSVRVFTFISVAFYFLAFLLYFLVSFQRLRVTFARSRFRMSQATVRRVHAVMSLSIVLIVVAIALYIFDLRLQSALLGTLPVLAYGVASIAIGTRFVYLTMQIAREVDSATDLLNASLRLSLVNNIAVFSSLLTGLLFLIRISSGDGYWMREVYYYFLFTDPVISAFALLFSFKFGESKYRWVLGNLHDWLLRYLIEHM